jgi:predicted nucleic acid-binding Zn ribbon protein
MGYGLNIFFKKRKYKVCCLCGYRNELDVMKCSLCGSEKLIEYEEKEKKKWIFYIVIVFIVMVLLSFLEIKNRKKTNKIVDDIPVFVSEKRMINYHTYLMSIKNMSYIKPDEHDIDVIKKAMKSQDPVISSSAISTFRLWRKKGFVKE